MEQPEIKRRKTQELRLTRFELLHLRDLMTVVLPPEGKQTLSGALAVLENRTLIEAVLWKKVSKACEEVGLPLGDEAPDYVIAAIAAAPLGVFQLAHDPNEDENVADDNENKSNVDDDELFNGKKEE